VGIVPCVALTLIQSMTRENRSRQEAPVLLRLATWIMLYCNMRLGAVAWKGKRCDSLRRDPGPECSLLSTGVGGGSSLTCSCSRPPFASQTHPGYR
jgi:hypothetical protein